MPQITFSKLLDSVAADGCDTECIERFQFICAVKNLTEKSMHGYAQRLLYLHRYAISINKSLVDLNTRELQQYILSIIPKVSGDTEKVGRVLPRHANIRQVSGKPALLLKKMPSFLAYVVGL